MHDIAIKDHVFLALKAEFAGFLGARFAIVFDIVRIGDGFRADETLFEIRMNDAGGGGRLGALGYGPGPCFLGANGEISDEMQEVITSPDNAVEARLFKTDGVKII